MTYLVCVSGDPENSANGSDSCEASEDWTIYGGVFSNVDLKPILEVL